MLSSPLHLTIMVVALITVMAAAMMLLH
jgi:hypothetical protein